MGDEKLVIDVEELAIFMHETYEDLAKKVGWKTQESCRVEFQHLPLDNKRVMRATSLAVVGWFNEKLKVVGTEVARK